LTNGHSTFILFPEKTHESHQFFLVEDKPFNAYEVKIEAVSAKPTPFPRVNIVGEMWEKAGGKTGHGDGTFCAPSLAHHVSTNIHGNVQ
jgi:hypothetical protein